MEITEKYQSPESKACLQESLESMPPLMANPSKLTEISDKLPGYYHYTACCLPRIVLK